MSFEVQTTGRVEGGVLKTRNVSWMKKEIANWPNMDVVITIEKAHATRSLDQNALYWSGYVAPISEYTGHSPDWVHTYLKQKFLPKRKIEIVNKTTGVVVDEVELAQLTTTTLNKIEFGDYLNQIEEWVIEEFHDAVRVGSNREGAA